SSREEIHGALAQHGLDLLALAERHPGAVRAARLFEGVVERPPGGPAGRRRRAQAQRRDALERLGQSLADLSHDIVDGHLDALQLEKAVEASIERAYLAPQRDAGRVAPDDEHGRAGLAARI